MTPFPLKTEMILDIHTHKPAPQPEAVISCAPADFRPLPGQAYSLGLHPWYLTSLQELPEALSLLERLASHPQVLAIGECGLDSLRGAPMALQISAFRAQALLAEGLDKPLIIHDVKCHDSIISLRKELRPSVPWIIHGFRGKPSLAKMLLDSGLYLSFGARFNPAALAITPTDRLLAETDDSPSPLPKLSPASPRLSTPNPPPP